MIQKIQNHFLEKLIFLILCRSYETIKQMNDMPTTYKKTYLY